MALVLVSLVVNHRRFLGVLIVEQIGEAAVAVVALAETGVDAADGLLERRAS